MKTVRLIIFGMLFATVLWAQGSIGLQVGLWKPSSLDENPSKPFANIKGSGPSLGLFLASPEWQGFALQATAWTWRQALSDGEVQMLHLSADLKNLLISQTRIRPYVTYGAAVILGRWQQADLSQQGMSINFGAGLEFSLLKSSGIALEYQYIYTVFKKAFGANDNYSGNKMTAKWFYRF